MADPTVTDVFNQLVLANGKLDQIELNTSLVTMLNASINSGFTATVNGLKAVAIINIESVKLQYYQTQQNETIICYLEQISKQTCAMLNLLAIQTELQQQMRDDLSVLRYVGESAQPGAVLEKQRHDDLKRQIEDCCPPRPEKAPCDFKPCERPKPIKPPQVPHIDITVEHEGKEDSGNYTHG